MQKLPEHPEDQPILKPPKQVRINTEINEIKSPSEFGKKRDETIVDALMGNANVNYKTFEIKKPTLKAQISLPIKAFLSPNTPDAKENSVFTINPYRVKKVLFVKF